MLINVGQGGTALHSARFHLLPVDLRVDPSESLEPLLYSVNEDNSALLDPSVPTLLVFECVLVYMSPESSSRLLRWFVEKSRSTPNGLLGSIVYEMFGLDDAFGRVMVNNLKASVPPVRILPPCSRFTNILGAGNIPARCHTVSSCRKPAEPLPSDRFFGSQSFDTERHKTILH